MRNIFRRSERGSGLLALFVSVTVCGAVSIGVLVTSSSRNAEAQAHMSSQKALQLAEAGADWGITQIRIRNGTVPTSSTTQTISGSGTFTCRYASGRPNNSADTNYTTVLSTGTSGQISRSVRVVLKKQIIIPSFDAAVQLNVSVPILDLNGNSFTIQGGDHNTDGTVNGSGTSKYGIASPATVASLVSQIASKNYDQITGLGYSAGTPSVGQVPLIDLNSLFAGAIAGASVDVPSGTQTNLSLGDAVSGTTVLAYCNGDLHLSGNAVGAGILAVDGDLDISGGFLWTGIVLVRGRVTLTGGGGTKRLVGALAVGQDITSSTSTTTIDASGTVDLLYSASAVQMAANAFCVMTVASWGEVANP